MNSHFLDRRYRILKVLKDGEKAKTYLVEDVNLSAKKFVVKRLYFSTNNTQNLTILHRLLASKVTTLEQLGQENDQIQKQVAYFEENEEFYLVQEFIPGNPLTDEILPGQPLREDQVISLLSEILEILIVVHSRGVIHQDIKPENIIRRDSDKKLVLVDFNSINEVSSNSHHLEYTPIEQVNGNLKYNSDIYALGIVAIAALLGLSTNEISHVRNQKHRFTKEIIWHNKNLKINRKLINIINKMVRFDYRKRYQYATEVLDDLKKLTSLEHNQQNRHSKKLLLVMTGIAGCMTLGIVGWFLQLQKSEDNPQQKLYQEGLNKYDAANYEGAIQDFSQLIKLEPKNALAYNKRGDAYYRLGDYEQAQTDSSQAILLNPQDANAYYDRGFALYELRKYKEAIADYTQAIKFNSQDAYAYYGRGLARVQIKDNKGALGDFTKAIAIKPEYREAYLQRGILRRRLKLRQAAMQDFDKIIKIDPSDARAFYQRGLTQVINKQKYAALKDYSDAININPKYIEAYLNRGDIYSDLGNKIEASEDYNTIIKLDPKFVPAYIHRGIHRFSFGDYKGAIQDYTEALKLDPNDAAAYNNRGNAYLELGNRKAANQDYSQAIAIDANNALAYYNRGVIRAKQKNKQGAIADFRKAAKLFQQQGEKDSYQDTQREIAILQNKSGTGNITRPKSSGREKKGSREN
ncbi:serine/threonine protein kinase [Nostoc linckia z18]|uniref:Serine/threonine protein kinase n=6 Tax=Nostoc linckia TaxID=92942 RepID=A0A9Q5Z557_NOSLI|nr:tetratricopeptide repeat protein [Nostoc linckia]PHK31286.1 serine/threonine protein kinase [Nostoc linckia z15]PHK43398.1 serine/threonine protein kinase [Nostoc linckia z16]PHJ57402.1 serine/threonine protein kinase [Nostoc linckia z1]PHJ60015.1 serine/threonine protein kinase [Nostoc linckia z3]PHJ64879.1 serine/threonine protein kinase [Nostoc linckia z2]